MYSTLRRHIPDELSGNVFRPPVESPVRAPALRKSGEEDDVMAWCSTEQTDGADVWVSSVNVHCDYTVAHESLSTRVATSDTVSRTSGPPHVCPDKCLCRSQSWMAGRDESKLWKINMAYKVKCLLLLSCFTTVHNSVVVIVTRGWSQVGNWTQCLLQHNPDRWRRDQRSRKSSDGLDEWRSCSHINIVLQVSSDLGVKG